MSAAPPLRHLTKLDRFVERVTELASQRSTPWLLWLVSLVVRFGLGFAALQPGSAAVSDENAYVGIAHQLVVTGTFSLVPGELTAHRMPGYPLLLAAIEWLHGPGLLVPRCIQALGGSTTPVATFLLARVLFGPGAALLAGVLAAFDPFLVYYDWRLWAESPTIALTAWTLYFFARRGGAIRWREGIPGGLLLGAILYLRPDALTLGPAIVAWLAFVVRPWREWLRVSVAMGLTVILCLVPWQIRNYRAMGHFIPLTTEGGFILWQTNNVESMTTPGIRGFWYPWPGKPNASYLESPDLSTDPRFAGLKTEVEIDRRCKELVHEFWSSHLSDLPLYVLVKWARFFALSPAFSFWPRSFVAISRLWYGVMLTGGVIGLSLGFRRRAPVGIFVAVLVAFFVKAAIVQINFRYRLQVEVLLLSLTSYAVFSAVEALLGRDRPARVS